MIRPLLLVLVLLKATMSVAQFSYGNQWIDHDLRYWRFNVFADGIYRIDSTALANAGFPVTSVDPAEIMLFAREKQVPIFISEDGDGLLNGADFIEFHGLKNDGWLDAKMYTDPAHQANPYYSLYNDTIRYFLTWDAQSLKERIASYSNVDFDSHGPRAWYWGETVLSLVGLSGYRQGKVDDYSGASSGFYVEGEGRFNNAPLNATSATVEQTQTLATPRVYSGSDAPPAKVNGVAVSISDDGNAVYPNHHLRVKYGPAPGVVMVDTIYRGVKVVRTEFEVPVSALATNLQIRYEVPYDLFGPGQVGAEHDPTYDDVQVTSNTRIRYAKDMNLHNQTQLNMWLPPDPSDPVARLEFTTFSGVPLIYVWGDSLRRIQPTQMGSTWKALLPQDPSGEDTRAYLYRTSFITMIDSIVPVSGDGYFTDLVAAQEDSAVIIVTHSTLMSGAMDYASYRESQAPLRNRSNVVIADVDELYDQFGGGIPKHAFAIRRFAKYILDEWNSPPHSLFLIGKSVQTPYINSFVPGYRPDSQGAYARCLVPSFGYPSSDPCFTIGLGNDPNQMSIPVGRLSARNNNDIQAYLDKVNAFEHQPPAAWMKNILHFRGGFNAAENNQFATYLNGFAQVAQDTSFGGHVTDFIKTSSDIFQQASADSVRHLIEDEGVTLMNFFAHAYSENFDITIDNPANYDWHGKHPLVIGNSCYIGNIHLNNSTSTGEQWVLMPNKGPIGFMSTVSTGLAPTLAQYTQEFYRSFSQVNYGGSIGQHMAHAVRQQLSTTSDLRAISNAQQFTLEGDPSLILNSWPEPDYAITDQDIIFDPVPVTADVDTFTVKAVVRNIGKAVNATFNVALDRTNTSLGPTQTHLTTLSDLHFQDTAYFRIPTQAGEGGEGVNAIQVRVDLDPDEVVELQETLNNVAQTTLFITSGDVIPAYPYDYAILPDPAPPLKASTGDPLAPVRTYVFQIDTTDLFNSAVLETGSISAPGGVVTWQPSSIYALNNDQDSTVFYWRCSIDSTGNGGYNWYERSFQYITGQEGWGQAHYFQFKNDTYNGVIYDRPEREFDFFSGQRNLRAFVRDSIPDNNTGWNLDLQPQEYNNGCGGVAAWMIAVIDPYTFEPWGTYWQDGAGQTFNVDHQFGNLNNGSSCRDRVEQVFSFRTNDATQLAGMADMLDNQVPVGHHILAYTWRYLDQDGTTANGPAAVTALQNLGVPDFSTLRDSAAYIFYVRKGYPTTFQDTIAPAIFPTPNDPNEDGIIDLSVYVSGLWNQGTITTMQAGPASAWHGLYWNEIPSDAQDSTRIKLIGVTPSGTEVELLDNPGSMDEVIDLGSFVSAAQYPTLRIKGSFFDFGSQQPKPSQMERWQLLSSPAPECAIDPPLGYFNALNDLFQGQDASVAVAVHNIGVVPMDSLLMTAWVVDRNNVRHRIHYKVNGPLPVDGVIMDTVRFSTVGFGGPNTLIIEANPIDTLTGQYHQLEQYHFNNLVQWRFNVEVDEENPLLDVTFDGVHILDGDIVSARPEIVMTLDDENPVLLLDSPSDTASFKVYLTRPGANLERLYFRTGAGVEQLRFEPATGPENECRIIYSANFPTDGKYVLTVQASDLSNNVSGDHDYKVSFEVLNRPTITEVLNYPNPFTTSTRFVFTVTGVEPPTYMKIQIMTVTGRVVREVKMHELGPIRVGRNMTEFAWDGTDEFGDRLARGVYLYRVIAQLNGQDIEYRRTGAADHFTKGFGKMYLLR